MDLTIIPRQGKIPHLDGDNLLLPPVIELDGSEPCGVILPTIWLDLTDEQRDRFLDNTRCALRLLGFKLSTQTDYTGHEREFWLSGIACVEVTEYSAGEITEFSGAGIDSYGEIYHPISQKDVEVSIRWTELVDLDNIQIQDRIAADAIEQINEWIRFDPIVYQST
jgi:hypothetical protein